MTAGSGFRLGFKRPGPCLENAADLQEHQNQRALHPALQFRAEAFNVLNHTNFGIGSPGSAFRSTNSNSKYFGVIANAYEPRQIQLALKLLF